MIEVARALVKSKCQLKYSIIFVAFDKEEVAIMMMVMVVMMMLALNLKFSGHLYDFQFCYGSGGEPRQPRVHSWISRPNYI